MPSHAVSIDQRALDVDAVELTVRLRGLMSAQSATDVARAAVELGRWTLGVDISWCGLREGDVLRMYAQEGMRDPNAFARHWSLPIGQGIGGRVALDGRPVVTRDYSHDPRRIPVLKELIDGEELRSGVTVAVASNESIFGVLYLSARELRTFCDAEIELAAAIGRAAGTAMQTIQTSELLQRNEQRARKQRSDVLGAHTRLRAIADAGSQSEDASKAVRGSLHLLAATLGAETQLVDQFGVLLDSAGEVSGDVSVSVPLGGRGESFGELRVIAQQQLSSADRELAEDVGRLITGHLLTSRAIVETELRLNSEFLDDLLSGVGSGRSDAFLRRASLLGFNVNGPATVICIGAFTGEGSIPDESGPGIASNTRTAIERSALDHLGRTVSCQRGTHVVLIVQADGTQELSMLSDRVRQVLAEIGRGPKPRHAAGIGRICSTWRDYATSYAEATMGLSLAATRPEPGGVLTPADLGLYALFGHEETRTTLDAVVSRALGPLIEADKKAQSEYVKTLSVFLANDRHLERTAKALHVHVNTLRYRVGKIQGITGVDLRDVDSRFLLELAMRIRTARGD